MSIRRLLAPLAALALLLGSTQAALAQSGLPDFTELVKRNAPAVVNVNTEQDGSASVQSAPQMPDLPPDSPLNEFFKRFLQNMPQQPRAVRSLGSGTIIGADGYILTNAHVVKDADQITVRFSDQREMPAKLVGMDERSDIALLKVDATGLPTVQIGDSDKLQVGEWVVAIGSPFGLEHTATAGIVSALGRNLPSDNYVPFIQTDAAVNPGNSGGPLFDTEGNLVGINSQIFSKSGGYMGLSFAIPINIAMKVANQLKTTGHVERGWLGVVIQGVTQDLAETFGLDRPRGALVSQVTPDSPASKAGLKPGDIILAFNGQPVDHSGQLPPMVGDVAPGQSVDLTVQRSGKPVQLKVTIEALTDDQAATADGGTDHAALKMTVKDLTADQRNQIDEPTRGVLVTDVGAGPAANAGIRPGDVILAVGGTDVTSAAQFAELAKDLPAGKPVPLLVHRGDTNLFFALQMPKDK